MEGKERIKKEEGEMKAREGEKESEKERGGGEDLFLPRRRALRHTRRGREGEKIFSHMDAQARKERRRKWRSLCACGSEGERRRCRGGEEKKEEEGEREQRKGGEEREGRERRREKERLWKRGRAIGRDKNREREREIDSNRRRENFFSFFSFLITFPYKKKNYHFLELYS